MVKFVFVITVVLDNNYYAIYLYQLILVFVNKNKSFEVDCLHLEEPIAALTASH